MFLFWLLLLSVTSAFSQEVKVAGQRSPSHNSFKVVVSDGCVTQADAADETKGGTELSLSPGSPLIWTHRIQLVPAGSSSGPGSGPCGCDGDLDALRERIERLEREVSALREKCGDPETPGCCPSSESKGSGCSIDPPLCPSDCSDQGRCVDGRCQCFPGFRGADCAEEECPVACGPRGRCVDGECQCDPGFAGPDCSRSSCPDNCSGRGKCVDGKCVCEAGFGGGNCAEKTCPGNCNNRGRCVDGKCVCDSGFRGDDCGWKACPGDCGGRGTCVDGKCVCNPGFGGENCADKTCPGNCGNRGRCVDGKCVCEVGFSGLDCSGKTCPDNCGGRGTCVDGKCVCNPGFVGKNCADKTCPGNCGNRGRCVDGKCVCNSGFKGDDCAERACPDDCGGRGKCVDGQCVCEAGFTGVDCSTKGCPGNCSKRGRCVKGKCICRKGFRGADCAQCQEGLAGPNCDTVMSAVEQLHTKDLTQSSVTVVWTQPPVQYESYLLVFTSQKDSAEVQAEVPGSASSFTQMGLAPGQSYTVTVTGKMGDSRGAPGSTGFSTLASGPSDLRVVKTSTSSVVVQWEPSLSEVDRYRLTVSRGDRVGQSQELTFDPGASSAHITQLEAGVRYDLALVAEKGRSQSEPVTTQATPGSGNVPLAALTVPTPDHDKRNLSIHDENTERPVMPNVTKVIRRIHVRPSTTGDQSKRDQTMESGTNFESDRKITPKDTSAGIDLTTPETRRTCLSRSDGRSGLKDKTSECTDDGTDDGTAEGASGANKSEPAPSHVDQRHKDLEISQGRNLAQPHTFQKLLTDTFNNLNVTTFAIHLSEPSNINSNAEIVARQIMQGLKPVSMLKKSMNFSENSEKLQIMSSERSQTPNVSPTPTKGSFFTNSETIDIMEDDDTKVEHFDDSMKQNERKVLGGYRRTLPNRTTIGRLRPNVWPFRYKSRGISRNGESSLPLSSQFDQMSTVRPMLATEKSSLSDTNIIDLKNNGVSEGAKIKETIENPTLPNVGPFQNKSPYINRFLRRPMRILNNKTLTATPHDEALAEPLSVTDKDNEKEKLSIARATLNRSRLAFPRRPNLYVGASQNRTRLFLRPSQRGSSSRNWTAESPQNESRHRQSTAVRENGETGHLKGLDPEEIDSGKDDVETFTQRIDFNEKDETVKLAEDDQAMPQDELQIMENKGLTDIDHEDSSVILDGDGNAKENGQDIPDSFAKQEKNNPSPVTNSTKNHQSDEQDGILSTKPEEDSPGGEGKQSISSSTVFRRRFKPARFATRNHLSTQGLDSPETNYQNVFPARERQDADTESNEGHKLENVLENDKQDAAKEEDVSTSRRGEPNLTVTRRLRPDLWQFRNKTVLNPRRNNVSLSTSSKINSNSAGTPIAAARNPSLGGRQASDLDFNKVLEGERLREDEGGVARDAGESKSPTDPLKPDKVSSESDYKVTVLGKGSGVLSRLHKLVISTGPEPPSDLVFSHVTEDSVTVSWTRPKSAVSGFKITYTHLEEGEPVSVSLDQGNSSLDLTRLSPGSTYEVSVLSVLGLDESDLISKTLHTLPDPPTDLRAVNVTDSGALLLWRPALAAVEKYTIVYGSGSGSEVQVTVSGNTAEERLKDLQPSTTYSVTIRSELDTRKSKGTSTRFTTTASGVGGARDLIATHVTPRTATLSWKPPSRPVNGYRLTYQTEGQKKEVTVSAAETRLNLTRLFAGAEYFVELQPEGGGDVLSTTFTTGSLQFPFPSDCSEEQLNGPGASGPVDIFPLGRQGAALSVWCDMETDGGGWTVFQRRKDGSVDFFRSWKDYVRGFGDPSGEFWLGLDALHTLTTRGRMTLRVDLRDGPQSVFAQYSTFEVAKRHYRLTVGGYSGTAGDSMTYHNNHNFSTKDRDPSSLITRCAVSYRGGWWYKNCHEANLNGLYGISSKHQGIIWTSWKGKEASIPFTEMKMRPTDFLPNNNYRH